LLDQQNGLCAKRGIVLELPCWLTSLLGWNNTLVTATQGCMGTIKGHKADGRLSARIARACAGASWSQNFANQTPTRLAPASVPRNIIS